MNPSPSAWARVKSLFLRASQSSRPEVILGAARSSDRAVAKRMLEAESAWSADIRVDEPNARAGGEANSHWLFAAGTLVGSRFEIIQPLGRGGMGEVYEARDRVKNHAIALKVLLPNPALDTSTADRLLRREVMLAQMVSHRNICRIYDPYFHESEYHEPMLVVSMELLRGKTLWTAMREKGRFGADEAVAIARQLAAGIDAAHAAGVVHRDLKPSNVILVDEGDGQRAVITDFGMARQVTGQTVSQLSQAVAGTLRYMAPEQMEGRADKHSDLYTFALILYELLTGELPFYGDSDLSLALNRLSSAPRDPASVAPGISMAWRAALLRGLSRRPEERFPSAGKLIGSVDHPAPGLLLWPRLVAFRVLTSPVWVRVAIPLALILLAAPAVFLLRPSPRAIPPFSHILVADVRHGETKDGALLGAGAALAAAVAQSPHLSEVRPSDLGSTLSRMGKRPDAALDDETIRQLAMRTGQTAALFGSISKDRGYSLHLRLETMGVDTRRGARSVENDFEAADAKDLFAAIASAASWVRKLSGEGARELDEQNARPEDLTTGSWEALRLLQEARARRAANDPQAALLFAKEALALDPEFAAAESFSADTHTDLRQYKEAFAAYERALDLAKKRNVTGRERFEIEAAYNIDAGDQEASLDTYNAWMAHFPLDYLPHFYLGSLLFDGRGDYQAALPEMIRAQQLGPGEFVVYPHLAAVYLAGGQFAKAQWCADQLRKMEESDWALEVEGLALLAQHRFRDAAAKVRPLATRKDGVFSSVGPRYVATAFADMGLLRDAEESLRAMELEGGRDSRARFADRQLMIAFLQWTGGNEMDAVNTVSPVLQDLDDPDSLALAAALCARAGDFSNARLVLGLMSQWPAVPSVTQAVARIKAEIALARHAPAADELVKSAASGFRTPMELEFLLHAAGVTGKTEVAARIKREIRERKDIELGWGETWTPLGLRWLGVCSGDCKAR